MILYIKKNDTNQTIPKSKKTKSTIPWHTQATHPSPSHVAKVHPSARPQPQGRQAARPAEEAQGGPRTLGFVSATTRDVHRPRAENRKIVKIAFLDKSDMKFEISANFKYDFLQCSM